MFTTRNIKRYNNILKLYNKVHESELIGYTDKFTNRVNFLKSPSELYNNNMCMFINLEECKLNDKYKLNLISYNSYIISNSMLINKFNSIYIYDILINLLIYHIYIIWKLLISIVNQLLIFVQVMCLNLNNKYKL